jgi:hypothetical protein
MFNLLMQYVPWEDGRGSVQLDRMFEYTEDAVANRFREGKTPRIDKLIELPCFFMREGMDDQVARVGSIGRARIVGKELTFEFSYDPEVPPLINQTVFAHKSDFDMPHEFEFTRSHWAVKGVDLFRLLLRLVRPRRQRPTVFTIEEHERIQRELVSVMMPFDAGFAAVYESIRQAAGAAGLRARRADDIWEAPAIIQDVVSLIDRSRVVICDCTGRNPNVFYETGIAHTLGREVLLIAQNEEDIPFDLRHLRYLKYLNNAEGRQALVSAITTRLQTIGAS